MTGFDPWAVLGLEPGADAAAIDAAHRAVVARNLGDAAIISRADDARAVLADPAGRARERLFGPRPLADVGELADALRALPRAPAGAALWLELLRERA